MVESTPSIIQAGNFCVLTSDALSEWEVNENDTVYIAGAQPFMENEGDPYWLRLKYLVVRVDADGHVMRDTKMLIVDPKNLEQVDEEMQERLTAILEADFAQEEKPEDVTTH